MELFNNIRISGKIKLFKIFEVYKIFFNLLKKIFFYSIFTNQKKKKKKGNFDGYFCVSK